MPSSIPIENLYYLFCYACDHFKEGRELAVGATKCPSLVDLLGTVLVNGVKRLRRRGLDRAYIEFEEEIREIRGRIAFSSSLKRSVLNNGKACCLFDELNHDVPPNRIIRATLASLLRVEQLDTNVRRDIRSLEHALNGVSLVRIQKTDFSRIQLHRNNIFYNLVLKICELVYDLMIPTEKPGKARFSDILRNETKMAELFENFVRNFYIAERKTHKYEVVRENIKWIVSDVSVFDAKYLPMMKTDVCLKSPQRKIILDTKFYEKTFDTQFGSETPKVKSVHLYQLFSYLTNEKPNVPNDVALEGILLYPTVSEDVELSYRLGPHPVRVATVDLSKDWRAIHNRLLNLVSD